MASILGEEQPVDLADTASAKERMAHKLKSPQGDQLYRLRKQTVELRLPRKLETRCA